MDGLAGTAQCYGPSAFQLSQTIIGCYWDTLHQLFLNVSTQAKVVAEAACLFCPLAGELSSRAYPVQVSHEGALYPLQAAVPLVHTHCSCLNTCRGRLSAPTGRGKLETSVTLSPTWTRPNVVLEAVTAQLAEWELPSHLGSKSSGVSAASLRLHNAWWTWGWQS